MHDHLIRYGLPGHIGRFRSTEAVAYERDAQVVCRTHRGLEIGRVLAPVQDSGVGQEGELIRRVTVQDNLLLARLEKNRDSAFDACCHELSEQGLPAALIDVETLFDGQSIYFYFLGELTPELERITEKLASVFEAKTKIAQFGETLEAGCGPDCGTENGAGCGESGGCSSCPIAKACATHH